jgi:hypothetical protein
MGVLKIGCKQHLVGKPEGEKNILEVLQVYGTNIRRCLSETERRDVDWTHFGTHSSGGLSSPHQRSLAPVDLMKSHALTKAVCIGKERKKEGRKERKRGLGASLPPSKVDDVEAVHV